MDSTLSFDGALALVLEAAAAQGGSGAELLPLLDARGRTLAHLITADRDQPPFDRSTRDGFAVRAGEGLERTVIGQLRAGEQWTGPALGAGEAIEIMTGAPLPQGADAVLMVEHVQANASLSHIHFEKRRAPVAGQYLVHQGAELRAGAIAVPMGTRLGAAAIATAASVGAADVTVFRRPRVAILATGDELVELGGKPAMELELHQIRNSNSYAMAAMVAEAGGEPVPFGIIRDRAEELTAALGEARMCDLILFSGGVSMGKYDLVEGALAAADAHFFFTGVRMQPGRPIVFGSLPALGDRAGTFFFGLPGNPVSTQVTFLCFVVPLLRAMCGSAVHAPTFVQATLANAVKAGSDLTRLLPAYLRHEVLRPSVTLVPWQGSGDLAANAQANCYALLPPHRADFMAGEVITVLLR